MANRNWYNLTMDPNEKPSPDDPVAYDTKGQPLYSHPQQSAESANANNPINAFKVAGPTEPEKPIISQETKLKHDRSAQMYSDLDLSDDEYVIHAVKRHPIGLFMPFIIGFFLVFVSSIVMANSNSIAGSIQLFENPSLFMIKIPVIVFIAIVVFVTYVAYYIYSNNKFFLTNESVIQKIQTGLFSKNEQTVSLIDIEDASYTQNGIMQQFFNYGSIRLSIQGEETTYRFSYAANPKQCIATITNAIKAFKNDQPDKDND